MAHIVEPGKHALIVAILFSLPLAAVASEPANAGVWKGTLGRSDVVLCINGSQDAGSYYYAKHRMPIQLARDGQRWNEVGDTGKWTLTPSASGVMAGTWDSPKGGAALPISLALVSSQTDPAPCASDAYNAALETMPQLKTGARQTFNGFAYRTLRIADVETLELLDSSPGTQAVNRQLRDMLPKTIDDLSDYFSKRRAFLGRTGSAAEDETSATPQFWNGEFVTIRFNRWSAGEGRRGASSDYITWDLKSGTSANVWTWFTSTPKVAKGSRRHRLFKTAPPAPECQEGYYGKGEFQLTLEEDAVRFWEEAYGDACEENIRIPYHRLSPILSAEGKRAVARLMGKRQR